MQAAEGIFEGKFDDVKDDDDEDDDVVEIVTLTQESKKIHKTVCAVSFVVLEHGLYSTIWCGFVDTRR